jgi:hypothetical protein
MSDPASTQRLRELVERLLAADRREHDRAIDALAGEGDRRVVPHLVEVATLHAVATDWGTFGFPEVVRDGPPPRSLTHPEVRWPGAVDALNAVAEPTYDGPAAWLRWESWATREAVDPLDGFGEWKAGLYRRFHPLVGQFLDRPGLDPATVRWGNTDPAALHPLNGPELGRDADHLRADDVVFGVRVEGTAVAVPRYLLFPHELANVRVAGVPLAVTYCTMCNSPLAYDRRVGRGDGDDEGPGTLTFGSTGLIRDGNKLMYDEETRTLWSQHRGVPVAGDLAGEAGRSLELFPVASTGWADWRDDHPETLVLGPDTGYGYDYEYYRDYEGFIREHYWENEAVAHPGVAPAGSRLDDKEPVYGIDSADGVRVYPVEAVEREGVVVDDLDGRPVAVTAVGGDVAAYEAPPTPLSVEDGGIRDAGGRRWRVTHDALVAADGERRDRVPGRHGLWLAFRVGYDDPTVATD